MGTEALEIIVSGRVQGVFYRAGLREHAARLGVTGWARNEPDGTVRAHVEGSAEALAELLEWCATGPPRARVDQVQRSDAEPTGARGFDVS
jgi:acylphosphatase